MRELTSRMVTLLAWMIAAVVLAGILPITVEAKEDFRSAKIFSASGDVSIKRGGDKLIHAFEGMRLQQGDIILSAAGATAVIEIDSDKTVTVDENTEIALSTLAGNAQDSQTGISVFSGGIVNAIQNKLSKGSSFQTETPTAIMGVRGTVYLVEQSADGPVVVVSSGGVQTDRFDAEEGSGALVEPGFIYNPTENTQPQPVQLENIVSFGPATVSALANDTLLKALGGDENGVATVDDLVVAAKEQRSQQQEKIAKAQESFLSQLAAQQTTAQDDYYLEQENVAITGTMEAHAAESENVQQTSPDAVAATAENASAPNGAPATGTVGNSSKNSETNSAAPGSSSSTSKTNHTSSTGKSLELADKGHSNNGGGNDGGGNGGGNSNSSSSSSDNSSSDNSSSDNSSSGNSSSDNSNSNNSSSGNSSSNNSNSDDSSSGNSSSDNSNSNNSSSDNSSSDNSSSNNSSSDNSSSDNSSSNNSSSDNSSSDNSSSDNSSSDNSSSDNSSSDSSSSKPDKLIPLPEFEIRVYEKTDRPDVFVVEWEHVQNAYDYIVTLHLKTGGTQNHGNWDHKGTSLLYFVMDREEISLYSKVDITAKASTGYKNRTVSLSLSDLIDDPIDNPDEDPPPDNNVPDESSSSSSSSSIPTADDLDIKIKKSDDKIKVSWKTCGRQKSAFHVYVFNESHSASGIDSISESNDHFSVTIPIDFLKGNSYSLLQITLDGIPTPFEMDLSSYLN